MLHFGGPPASSPRNPHLPRIQPRSLLLFVLALLAATAAWALSVLFVADDSRDALIALPFWLVAGALVGWLAVALRGRSRRLEAVGEAASDAIVRLDADATVAAWSPGAEALYG